MIDDCSNALNWVTTNIHRYGGDSNNIYLVGQSAGGHIVALTTMMKARREREQLLKDLESIQHQVIDPHKSTHKSLYSIHETANGIHTMRERSNTTILDGSNHVHQHINNTNGTSNVHTAQSNVSFQLDQATVRQVSNDSIYSEISDSHDTDVYNSHDSTDTPTPPHQFSKREALSILRRSSSADPRPLIDASVVSPVKHRTYDIQPRSSSHNSTTHPRELINLGTMHCTCCVPSFNYKRSRSASVNCSDTTNLNLSHKRKVAITQTKWKLSQIRCMIGVSGVYNLVECEHQMAKKGLPPYVLHSIMGTTHGIKHHELYTVDDGYHHTAAPLYAWSPTLLAHSTWFQSVVALFPPVLLLHGTSDTSSLWHASEQFGRALAKSGCKVAVKYYDGATHTDPIIEGPMAGHDHLMYDILAVIHKMTQHYKQKIIKKQIKQHINNHDDIDSTSSDTDSESDIDLVTPGKVDGYLPTATDTSDRVEPIPDFELEDNDTIQKIYHIKTPKPIIPNILINCARYVNPF